HCAGVNHFSWKPVVVVEVAVILLIALPSCNSGNILVIPVDGSHWVNMKVLMEELHLKGHIMTVIRGSNTIYIGNITKDFFHKFLKKMLEVQRGDKFLIKFLKLQRDFSSMMSEVHHFSSEIVSNILENTEQVKRLQEAHYDLVLTDPVIPGGVVLAHYLKLPLVLNVRWIPSGEGHSALAPTPLSYIPSPGSGFSDRMSFTERVINILYYGIILFQQRFMIGPHYQALCDRYFESSCDIETLIQSADIWLMRADFVFEFPRPTMPNVVYMGGFQCKPPKKKIFIWSLDHVMYTKLKSNKEWLLKILNCCMKLVHSNQFTYFLKMYNLYVLVTYTLENLLPTFICEPFNM
uniref:UDP glucuronosyltransferase 5 family, polypeptide D1 n=1 Tax=Paramormyrops kingsleyae TaxID=1676925 RepID=A0A3B3Q802_9TELE